MSWGPHCRIGSAWSSPECPPGSASWSCWWTNSARSPLPIPSRSGFPWSLCPGPNRSTASSGNRKLFHFYPIPRWLVGIAPTGIIFTVISLDHGQAVSWVCSRPRGYGFDSCDLNFNIYSVSLWLRWMKNGWRGTVAKAIFTTRH